jgi:hypothetical protein
MGWCSGTDVFDKMVKAILDKKKGGDPEHLIRVLIDALEEQDWDCHQDSNMYDTVIVQKVMRKMHPDWFDEK